MLRTTAATFAFVGLVATAAQAEVIGTIPRGPDGVGGPLPTATACGHTFTWKLDMEAGKFYALRVFFDRYGTATLRTAGGAEIASFGVFPAYDDSSTGHEARATSTGTYVLDITSKPDPYSSDRSCEGDGEGYYFFFQYDCPGGRRTDCTLPVGTTRKGAITFPGEWDWLKTTLKAGKRYDIASDLCSGRIVVRDAKGKPVAKSNDCNYDTDATTRPVITGFRPRTSGTYFVDVEGIRCYECGEAGPYTVSLKAR
jgi:hypothetical protein